MLSSSQRLNRIAEQALSHDGRQPPANIVVDLRNLFTEQENDLQQLSWQLLTIFAPNTADGFDGNLAPVTEEAEQFAYIFEAVADHLRPTLSRAESHRMAEAPPFLTVEELESLQRAYDTLGLPSPTVATWLPTMEKAQCPENMVNVTCKGDNNEIYNLWAETTTPVQTVQWWIFAICGLAPGAQRLRVENSELQRGTLAHNDITDDTVVFYEALNGHVIQQLAHPTQAQRLFGEQLQQIPTPWISRSIASAVHLKGRRASVAEITNQLRCFCSIASVGQSNSVWETLVDPFATFRITAVARQLNFNGALPDNFIECCLRSDMTVRNLALDVLSLLMTEKPAKLGRCMAKDRWHRLISGSIINFVNNLDEYNKIYIAYQLLLASTNTFNTVVNNPNIYGLQAMTSACAAEIFDRLIAYEVFPTSLATNLAAWFASVNDPYEVAKAFLKRDLTQQSYMLEIAKRIARAQNKESVGPATIKFEPSILEHIPPLNPQVADMVNDTLDRFPKDIGRVCTEGLCMMMEQPMQLKETLEDYISIVINNVVPTRAATDEVSNSENVMSKHRIDHAANIARVLVGKISDDVGRDYFSKLKNYLEKIKACGNQNLNLTSEQVKLALGCLQHTTVSPSEFLDANIWFLPEPIIKIRFDYLLGRLWSIACNQTIASQKSHAMRSLILSMARCNKGSVVVTPGQAVQDTVEVRCDNGKSQEWLGAMAGFDPNITHCPYSPPQDVVRMLGHNLTKRSADAGRSEPNALDYVWLRREARVAAHANYKVNSQDYNIVINATDAGITL